ncbi:MAG: flagellar hook-basal body complex protein [Planctomycetota bacterium]|nr:MAG: flagellar hook-basal body complex protein [Planctomycetota bacterium]REJ94381.1 MAG: flagellar hook-basal body complex protein [Planctomycetota bacterium]REK22086.1 MAG: flagellar hook-basal body complex protein [Planctomycetota bacterium]REK44494.1 MAG: flagellar hook-basal body complex protein [Planctomycetota bacterium]
MGLASALSTALTGLTAAETTIDVVGNNVANSNTVGFKASEAVFATQFLQTQGLGSSPTATRGGVNPRQIGLGTKVAEISPDFQQGTIEISSNPSDLAIQGDGFFIVQGLQGEQLYTRNGLFKTNSQNELVTINGQRLLGQGIDENFEIQTTEELVPLTIPLGASAVAQATENVFLEGTFTPTGDVATLEEIIQSQVLSDGTVEVPADLSDSDVAGIGAPDVSTSTTSIFGAGSVPAGTYNYKVAWVDADGNEGPPSAAFGAITIGGASEIQLSGVPTATGDFTSYNLYRSDATGGGTYTLVAAGQTTASPTDNAAAGTTALDESTLAQANYSYYVTFYDSTATGLESRPTQLIGPESITITGSRIRIENLPQPTSGGDFDSIRIYRNLSSDDDSFHLLTTLSAGQTSYIDGAADSAISGNAQIDLDGPGISSGLALVDVVQRDGSTYSNPFVEGTLSFTPRKGGRSLDTKELTITTTTTVTDLIEFMEEAFGIQETSPDPSNPILGSPGGTVSNGRLLFNSNRGEDAAVGVSLSAFQMDDGTGPSSINLGFNSTQTADGESAVADFVVFDSLGVPLTVRVTSVLEARDGNSTTYRWYADSRDNDPSSGVGIAVGTGTVVFDGEGNIREVTNATVSVDRDNVSSSSPLEFELDFSQISGLAADNASLSASRQDGSGAGTLSSFIIGENGRISGIFTNGVTRDLGQVRLARFANNAGLEQRGENLFSTGVNSGLPIVTDPGSQGSGSIVAGAVELSNTDIGQNLIELILASTQYRGNTRVITAVQELFDELLALRR